jgi:hypothetical protein
MTEVTNRNEEGVAMMSVISHKLNESGVALDLRHEASKTAKIVAPPFLKLSFCQPVNGLSGVKLPSVC